MNRWERVNCASFVAILATLLLLAGIQLQPATATPATPAPATQQVIPQMFRFHPVATVDQAREWAEATLSGSGVTLADNVTLLFSSTANCGADASAAGMGGCTYFLKSGPVVVISPELAWTQAGSHILFHETAHSMGIVDECAAEAWAHQFEDEPYWSYPECQTN
jgi:hypothetical protein